MKLFDKLLEKKKKSGMQMSENECKAKTNVVKSLKDFASEAMGKDLGGLKKVTVASNSEEGLKKGLDKAEEAIEGDDEDMEMASDDSSEFEGEESSDESLAALEEIPVDKIDEAIEKLLQLKKQSKV